jgi:hypothetical protein
MRILGQISTTIGLLCLFVFSGCGGRPAAPAVLTHEQLQTMTFQNYCESQNYKATKLGSIYTFDIVSDTSINMKYFTTKNVTDALHQRTESLESYCKMQGGSMLSKDEYYNRVNFYNGYASTAGQIMRDKFNSKLPYDNREFDRACIINNYPYFTYKTRDFEIPSNKSSKEFFPATNLTISAGYDITTLKGHTESFFSQDEIVKINSEIKNSDSDYQKRLQEQVILRKKQEQEKNLYDEQLKQSRKILRDRKGTQTFVLYDQYVVHSSYKSKSECDQICSTENLDSTGYNSIEDVLQDGWQFVSKIGDIQKDISGCGCDGKKYILKR